MNRKYIWTFVAAGILIFAIMFIYFNSRGEESFTLNSYFVRMSIPFNGEVQTSIRVTSLLEEEQNISFYFEGLEGIGKDVESSIFFDPYETKDVFLKFNDEKREVDSYQGYLVVKDGNYEKRLPVVLSVENPSSYLVITGKPIPQYSEVVPGGKFGVDLSLYNLRDKQSKIIKLHYSIKDFYGNDLIYDESNIQMTDSVDFSKVIDIPEDFKTGDYVFTMILEDNGNSNVFVESFQVEKKQVDYLNNFSIWLSLAVFVFVVGLTIFFVYFIKTRDEFLIQLRKQQKLEMERNLAELESYKEGIKRERNSEVRKVKEKEFKKIKKKVIARVKKKQKEQRKEIRKYHRKGKSAVEKKLGEWQKEGYKLDIFNDEKKSIDASVKEWKKQGYATGVLTKK